MSPAKACSSSTHIVGRSVERRPIYAHAFGDPALPARLILAAMHGDEPKTAFVARELLAILNHYASGGSCSHAEGPRERKPAARGGKSTRAGTKPEIERKIANALKRRRIVIVPVVNPDGLERRTRRNANKIDLNRNYPTKNFEVGNRRSRMFGGRRPASEPETRAIIRLIDRETPKEIITIHSIDRNRFCNNYDGPARKLAEKMSRQNGYPAVASIGYPTPGSFGTWAGIQRRIPTVTLELPSHDSRQRCLRDNLAALID